MPTLTPLLKPQPRRHRENSQDQKLSKICKDAGFLEKTEKGQVFITIEEGSEALQTACRESTDSRNFTTSRPRGWIRSNTKIGPVLDVKLYPHEGRYCVDFMVESLFKDRTVSLVRIMNGINKYVTEMSEEIPTENVDLFISTRRLVAKAMPQNPNLL